MGGITRRRAFDTYQRHGISPAHQQKLLGASKPLPSCSKFGEWFGQRETGWRLLKDGFRLE